MHKLLLLPLCKSCCCCPYAKAAAAALMIKLPGAGALGCITLDSQLYLRRDDGSDVTLLRRRATSSRAADALLSPKVVITGADRSTYLHIVARSHRCKCGGFRVSEARDCQAPSAFPSASCDRALAWRLELWWSSVTGKSSVAKAHDVHHHYQLLLQHILTAQVVAKAASMIAPAPSNDEEHPHFVAERIEQLSANGSNIPPARCNIPLPSLRQSSSVALRSAHFVFLRKCPSPPPSAAAHFIDSEEWMEAAALPAAERAHPTPPRQTFLNFLPVCKGADKRK